MVYRGGKGKVVMIHRKNKYVVYDDKGYVVIMSRMKDICAGHARILKEKLVRK